MVEERLAEAAAEKGAYFVSRLDSLRDTQVIITDVRGRGLLIGVEFKEPTSGVPKTISFGVVNALSREYLPAMVAGELASKHRVITAYTLNNPNAMRIEPALALLSTDEIDYVIAGLDEVLDRFKSIMSAALT